MNTEKKQPINIIDIPKIDDYQMFERNREKAESNNNEHCPCCGKEIKNAKYFINSIWGGCTYPKYDIEIYNDSWIMAIGSECRKKLPKEYVMTKEELHKL